MEKIFWVLVGFFLAVAWDKYKDWQRFRANLSWVFDEVKGSKVYLETKFNEFPNDLKEKIQNYHQSGREELDVSDLFKLPFETTKPLRMSAWSTFIASGYSNKIKEQDYSIIRETYESLEASNFLKGSIPTFIAVTSSSVFSSEVKEGAMQGIATAPMFPFLYTVPKINKALEVLKKITDANFLYSFICFIYPPLGMYFNFLSKKV